ncbi:MAG: hypothetical protein CVV49_06205 [Spirochaetae bacterium HGW-Spirochaetae-5]|nr:MAG: hypothetical protein CVV49_06205 [Spirochaetae bacterium HGW-Spirochaetae-5]
MIDSNNRKSDDASHVYRGYRRQILFILHKIVTSIDDDLIFCPEGVEDLSIERSGIIKEIYQIKDYTDNLILSHLAQKNGTSFIERANDYYDRTTEIILASYGPIGQELSLASKGDDKAINSVVSKIKNMAIIPSERIKPLVESIVFQQPSEEQITKEIDDILSASMLGIETGISFDLLCWWIFDASEKRRKITKTEFIKEIGVIGKFLKERSYHHEWLSSIIPFSDLISDNRNSAALSEEYKEGISAGILHIQEGLDIPRNTKNEQIKSAFDNTNVVIIHGASGQGKTTLAYRYFYDNFPLNFSYKIKEPAGKEHSYSISQAIMQHHKSFKIPMFLYYDIAPSDSNWTSIVESISHENDIKLLITIREEDWKSDSRLKEKISFKELEIDFLQDEAEHIFNSINQVTFLDFESSWQMFGGKGPLLEYIYFLNFGEKLEVILKNQIYAIQDRDTLDVLRIIALITSYNARAVAKNIQVLRNVNHPELLLEKLNKEYLISVTDDGNLIEGFHPVRSNIISRYLFDSITHEWINVFHDAFDAIYEKDLGTFLLYCFLRRDDSEIQEIVKKLNSFSPQEWSTYDGIIKSLLWLGIKQYAESNRFLADELKEKYPYIDLSIVLDTDIAGHAPHISKDIIKLYNGIGSESGKIIEEFVNKQTEKNKTFNFAKEWLSIKREQPELPINENDYLSTGRYAFWFAYFNCKGNNFNDLYELLEKDIDNLDIYTIAEISNGFTYLKDNKMKAILKKHERIIIKKFLKKTDTLYLEKTKEMVKAHYIIPVSDNEKNFITTDKENNNSRSMVIIDLMQKLYPDEKFYSTQGYGQNSVIEAIDIPEELRHDDSFKKINRENLPHPYLATLNGNFISYLQYKYRPYSWRDYIDRIIEIRRLSLDSFQKLVNGLGKYYKKGNLHNIVTENTRESLIKCQGEIHNIPFLPKIAVDEWGFTSEGIANDKSESQDKIKKSGAIFFIPSLIRYDKYRKACSDFFTHSSFFISQMASLISARLNGKDEENMLSSLNLTDLLIFLTVFQREFFHCFSSQVSINELRNIEEQENKIYNQLFSLWLTFSFHPDKKLNNPKVDCSLYVNKIFKSSFLNKFSDELNVLYNFHFELTEISIDERKSIYVIINIKDLNTLNDNAEDFVFVLNGLHVSKALNNAAMDYNNDELARLLKYHWNNLCYVITFKGKIIFNTLRKQSILSSIYTKDAPFMADIIEESFFEQTLNISLWHSMQIDAINKFYQNYSVLRIILLHMHEVIKPLENDDLIINEEMLNDYFQRRANELADPFESVTASFSDLYNMFEAREETEENIISSEDFVLLFKNIKQIYPEPEKDSGGKINCKLDTDMLKDWSGRVDSLNEEFLNAYFMILFDDLQGNSL